MAIIGVGMVGSGPMNEGIPAFVNALSRLSQQIDITIYSFIPVSRHNTPKSVRVRYFPITKFSNRFKFVWLGLLIICDHLWRSFDCFHAYSPYPAGVLAGRMSSILGKKKMVTLLAGEMARLPEINFGDLLNSKIRATSIKVCESSNEIIAFSNFQKIHLLQNLINPRVVHVVPFSLDVPALGFKKLVRPIQLLHVAHNHPIKDNYTLLNTIEILASKVDCQLTVCGEKFGDDFMKSVITKNLEGRVKLTGAITNDKLRALYESHHFLIHTSKFEGLPMVAMEAMAYGTVVCGTAVGVIKDLSPECCSGVEIGDHRALSFEIMKLIADPQSYQQLRANAHKWIKAHDINWHVNKMIQLYES